MSYPPQPPGPGLPQPPPNQPPEQQPYGGYPSDPFGPPPNYGQPGQGVPGYEQPAPGYEQPRYEQPASGPPGIDPFAAPVSGPQSGWQQQPPGAGFGQAPGASPPVSGQPMYPPGFGAAPGNPAPPKKSPALPLILGGVALLVVVAIVVGVVVFVNHDGEPSPPVASHGPHSSPSAGVSPSPEPSLGAGVQGDKLVDDATGWSFSRQDKPWRDLAQPVASEITGAVGQSVQLDTGSFATMEIGQLSSEFPYTGPGDLETVKSDLATSMLKRYYGDGASVDAGQDHKDQSLTQSGHKAWLWAFHVTYTSGGAEQGEFVVIALLDAGGGKAAVFWGSVPNGHDHLRQDMVESAGTLSKAQ